MILVVGVTGLLGGEICRQLSAAGHPVRALVRPTSDEGRVEYLRPRAELVIGDIKDRGSLDAACAGAEVVITTASTTLSRQPDDTIASVDQAGQLRLIEAAKASGVSRFVYISYSGNHTIDCALTTAKRAVEQAVRESGMTYTILRPSYFMEVAEPRVRLRRGECAGARLRRRPGPDQLHLLQGRRPLREPEPNDSGGAQCDLELGGPEALSPLDAVHTFERSTGRTFALEHLAEEVLELQHQNARDPLEQSFGALMLGYARGDVVDMSQTLDAFPLQLTSVREFADATSGRSPSLGTARVTEGAPSTI